MKKVGIITMHQVYNYGSFMQAYATQRSVEKLGYDAQIIDYKYPNELHGTRKSVKGQILHAANVATKALLPGRPYSKFLQHYRDAYAKYYKLSAPYNSREAIQANPPAYDVYMIGSDQVWNDKFVKQDDTFFAGFAPKGSRKVAFASSFGKKELEEKNVAFYQEQLKTFDAIAVRESSGVELAKKLTGRTDVHHVVDPSLLLSADEWKEMTVPFTKAKRKYIFCYGSHNQDYMLEIAKRVAAENDWDIYKVNGTVVDYFNRDVHYLLDVGPLEWLGLIENAAMVMACSFHGVAFSIQYNRPFLAVFTGNNSFDSRLENILQEFSLEHHRLNAGDPDPKNLKQIFETDWDAVNARLAQKRQESLQVLADILK